VLRRLFDEASFSDIRASFGELIHAATAKAHFPVISVVALFQNWRDRASLYPSRITFVSGNVSWGLRKSSRRRRRFMCFVKRAVLSMLCVGRGRTIVRRRSLGGAAPARRRRAALRRRRNWPTNRNALSRKRIYRQRRYCKATTAALVGGVGRRGTLTPQGKVKLDSPLPYSPSHPLPLSHPDFLPTLPFSFPSSELRPVLFS